MSKLSESIKFEGKVNIHNIIHVVVKLMKEVEIIEKSGLKKKTLVMEAVRELVDDGDDANETLLEKFVPALIDIIIQVDNQDINISIKDGFFSCCKTYSWF